MFNNNNLLKNNQDFLYSSFKELSIHTKNFEESSNINSYNSENEINFFNQSTDFEVNSKNQNFQNTKNNLIQKKDDFINHCELIQNKQKKTFNNFSDFGEKYSKVNISNFCHDFNNENEIKLDEIYKFNLRKSKFSIEKNLNKKSKFFYD